MSNEKDITLSISYEIDGHNYYISETIPEHFFHEAEAIPNKLYQMGLALKRLLS